MKKFIATTILFVIMVLSFVGCTKPMEKTQEGRIDNPEFVEITDYDFFEGYLVYDRNTKIVYYQTKGRSNSWLCPYYSENGNLCRFNEETGIIEEIY